MSLIDQIFFAILAVYFSIGTVACIALYEIRSGKVSAQELNWTEDQIDSIKKLDTSVYLIMFFFWGLAIFAPKGE
jgi:hypothetical protein